jgi:outer membrane lipoprotein-sorting protein
MISEKLTRLNLKLMKKTSLFFCISVFFLGGCSWMPRADVAEYSSQKRVLSAEHWGELAKDVVSELDQSYLRPKGLKRVYINPGRSDSAFDRAYESYLTRALMNIGY